MKGEDLHFSIDLNIAVFFIDSAMYPPEVFLRLFYYMFETRSGCQIFSISKKICIGVKNEESVKLEVLKLNQEVHDIKLTPKPTFEG
ncbi:MAG: hypothetical protein ACFFAN_00715 [Promethearchaeota archaeon]